MAGARGWLAADLERDRRWMHTLTRAEADDLMRALRSAQRAGRASCQTLRREDLPLDAFLPLIDWVRDGIENDTGIRVLRGLPVADYTRDELRLLYWGLGLHLGTPVSQSRQGDLLGDVRNFSTDLFGPKGRGYTTREHLNFHTDSCDVVGLLVLQTAMQGGRSMVASSIAIRDEIARTRPDLLAVLEQPFHWSWQEQEPPGAAPWYRQPIFSEEQGFFSSRYIRGHIRSAQRYPEVPRLTAAQTEAMDLIDRLANDERFCFGMMFEAGDFQFLNNHVTYHSRTAFEDFAQPERRRHLLRMWLAVPNSRPLAPSMGTIYQDRRAGAVRGGFPSRVGRHVYQTYGGGETS